MALAAERKRAKISVLSVFMAAIAAIVAANGPTRAQEQYPARAVRVVVPFATGGPTDIVGRVIANKLADLLGQPFFVENKTGAGGNIGADAVAKALPDGYTLLVATVSTHAINPGLYTKMPYDPIRDFAPIAQVGVTPSLLGVNPSLPVKTVQELIALVRDNPGKYTYGSSGVGSILHLCGEQLKAAAGGLEITHVPYRGSAPMMTDLVGGQITMAFDATPTAMPQALSGGIRALGAGMAQRIRQMPDLPTLQEQGLKGFECYTWNAILAPAGTPQSVIDKLAAAILKAMEDPAVLKALENAGVEPTPGRGAKETDAFIKAELAKWAPIIRASGAQVTN